MATNFESLKTIIYRQVINDNKFNFSLLGGENKMFHIKLAEGKKYLNELLDRMDIRAVANLNEELTDNFPKWFKEKRYCIDYNHKGELDFIKL